MSYGGNHTNSASRMRPSRSKENLTGAPSSRVVRVGGTGKGTYDSGAEENSVVYRVREVGRSGVSRDYLSSGKRRN